MRLAAFVLVVATATLAEETANWESEEELDGGLADMEYDPDQKGADHTAFAIAFDKFGDVEGATRAFMAAVRHGKDANTLVNLGVFMMRQRKFTGRGGALDAMWQAKTRYRTPESSPLVQENWAGLMKTMKVLDVEVPEKYRDKTGATELKLLPSWTATMDTEWLEWFGDETADELMAHGMQKDRDGEVVAAARAFIAAVRTTPTANTLVNLGVFMTRRRHFTEALTALHAARTTYKHTANADRLRHIEANWSQLLKTMLVLGEDIPAKYGDVPTSVSYSPRFKIHFAPFLLHCYL